MKIVSIVLAASLMLSATACSVSKGETELTSGSSYSNEIKSEVERLKEKYPEYFELSAFKGIEIYVWEMAEGSYHCGLMSGTNRNKTDEEIWDLARKPLSIEEAKLILNELKIDTALDSGTLCNLIAGILKYPVFHYTDTESRTVGSPYKLLSGYGPEVPFSVSQDIHGNDITLYQRLDYIILQ